MAPRTPEGQKRRGRRPSGQVTLKDLAQHLRLAPATVSLVINRSPASASIPARTQERIRAAALELNYRPNHLARSLRSRRSFTVGVMLPEISEGYAASVLAGIDDHLMHAGYFFLVASHRNDPALFGKYMGLLMDRAVEGLVLVNTPVDEVLPVPAVVVSGHRPLVGVNNVVVDHDRAATLALTHLAELGHRRIAFFKGHPDSSDTDERWRSIERAARGLGLEVRPELTLQLEGASSGGPFTAEEGYREGHVFGGRLLERKAAFTALFAFNDVSAIGAMRAFRDAGLRVPQEVSVVGFDDIRSAAFQNPSLTTVRQPLREMGAIAARTLLRRLGGEKAEGTVTVAPELVVRESTGPPPR
jgi:LacI family transcriptional regulator